MHKTNLDFVLDGTSSSSHYACAKTFHLSHSPSTAVGGAVSSVTAQELYQLRTYLQEAQHREQQIETKLAALQRLVSSTQVWNNKY